MEWIKTEILRQPWDVDLRLSKLNLKRTPLLNVRSVALSEAANATPNHCANASVTFAYQHGVWALRNEFLGKEWVVDRSNGVESILNKNLKVRVAFSNVDIACNEDQLPKPRSSKGAGSERICEGNLFGHLPHFAPRQSDIYVTYYLMVDETGAAELTQPVISAGSFSAYVERIFLSDGSDFTGDKLSFDNDDAIDDFDPQIIRK
jgi:hypothetical protein